MGVIAEGILRGCQGLFIPVSLGYPLSVFNKNSTLKEQISSLRIKVNKFHTSAAHVYLHIQLLHKIHDFHFFCPSSLRLLSVPNKLQSISLSYAVLSAFHTPYYLFVHRVAGLINQ